MAHVESGVEYRIDMTGLAAYLDLYYKGSDATYPPRLPAESEEKSTEKQLVSSSTVRSIGYDT